MIEESKAREICARASHRATPTFYQEAGEMRWILIDATNCVTGRLASFIAQVLRGKDSHAYSPNALNGRGVIVVNAEKIAFTGRKPHQKFFHRHSGYPGGIKRKSVQEVLAGPRPQEVLVHAVRGMLPDNRLRSVALSRLRVYSGPEHKHKAQNPVFVDFLSLNRKNALGNTDMATKENNFASVIQAAIEQSNKRLSSRIEENFSSELGKVREDFSAEFGKVSFQIEIVRENFGIGIAELRSEFHDSISKVETEQKVTSAAVDRVEFQQKETNRLLGLLLKKLG